MRTLLILCCVIFLLGCHSNQPRSAPPWPREKTAWLNTPYPLAVDFLKNKVVMIDFFTDRCGACTQLQKAMRRWQAPSTKQVEIVGVYTPSYYRSPTDKQIQSVLKRYGIQFPVMKDLNAHLMRAYGARVWPTIILINKQGFIAKKYNGVVSFAELDKTLQALVNMPDKKAA